MCLSHLLPQLMHGPDSVNTTFHATPAQALRMHRALRSRHSLAMHFATFAGSDIEAFDPIVALDQAKREMALGTGPQASEAETRRVDGREGETEPAGTVGNWIGTDAGPQVLVSEAEARRADGEVRETERPVTVGNWWMEGGMGVIDVGETAVVPVGGENPQGIRRDNLTGAAE